MTEWDLRTLDEVAFIQQGKRVEHCPPGQEQAPVFGANGVIGSWTEGTYGWDVVGLGCRGSVGSVTIVPAGSWLGNNVMGVWPRNGEVLLPFLRLLLEWSDLRGEGVISGQVQEQITRASLRPLRVPVPSVVEQQEICDLMRSSDALTSHLLSEVDSAKTTSRLLRQSLFEGCESTSRPLGDVAEVKLGRMLSKERSSGMDQAPYIRNANVQWRGLDLTDLKSMSFPPTERAKFALKAGDILACEGGDPGRCVLLESDLPGVFYQKAIHRVRATSVDPSYLYEALTLAYESGKTRDLCTSTTIQHLTAEKFRTLPVPVPTVEDQTLIAQTLRSARRYWLALEDELESSQRMRSALLENLMGRHLTIPTIVGEHIEWAAS